MNKWYIKDWILYEVIADDGGKHPKELSEVKHRIAKEDDVHFLDVKENNDGYTIFVGKENPHPNNGEHFINVLQFQSGDVVISKKFKSGEKPEFTFKTEKTNEVNIRMFCNLHGVYEFKK